MTKVLVTCVGSGVGQSVIDSLNLKGGYEILGVDTNRNVYAYQYCDEFEVVPGIYSAGYLDYLLKLCIEKKVDIIVPGHDHELLLFSKNIEKFHDKNIEVIVSRPDVIKASRDKFEWYNYFTKCGCSIVPTYKVNEFKENSEKDIFPAIVKPAGGSASQGILILNDISELERANNEDIIQPYLFPLKSDKNYSIIKKFVEKGKFVQMSEISIQLIFSKESEFKGIFISQNSLKSGIPVFVDPIDPESFEYIDEIMKFVPVCVENKVKGPVNIQGRITENGLIFFEMNMRFTGITGNRAQLGFNEVDYLINNFLGKPSTLNGFAKNKLGVRQVACTTIPRRSLNDKLNIIFNVETKESVFFQKFIRENNQLNYTVLVDRYDDLEELRDLLPADVILLDKSDKALESFLCQSDVFIQQIDNKPESNMMLYDSVLKYFDLLTRVIKSNIPLFISLKEESLKKANSEKELFKNDISDKFVNSIEYFTPATKSVILNYTKEDKSDDELFQSINESILNEIVMYFNLKNETI